MAMDPVFKAGHQDKSDPYTFVLSDQTVDRMGDVIKADGWSLTSFKSNPVALFGHDHTKIVGEWENVRVVGKRLLGNLKLAKAGTSDFIDTVRSLVDQGILKAVSVGFQPTEATPRKGGGYEYIKSTLHEVSLVAVPANPSALAIVKALNPNIADKLFVQSDSQASDVDGQSTLNPKTPKLNAARERFTKLGID